MPRHIAAALHRWTLCLAAMLLVSGLCAVPASAQSRDADVQTTWRLLDYIAVDYAGAVAGGKVISDGEYKEMKEFSACWVGKP